MEEYVDLLDCPFCGTSAHMESRPGKSRRNWKVCCSDEECMNHETVGWPNRESAVIAWNRRAVAPKHGATDGSRLGAVSWLDELLTLYDNASAAKWLASDHKLLNGKSPLQAIRDGESEDVARIVEQLTSGAFI